MVSPGRSATNRREPPHLPLLARSSRHQRMTMRPGSTPFCIIRKSRAFSARFTSSRRRSSFVALASMRMTIGGASSSSRAARASASCPHTHSSKRADSLGYGHQLDSGSGDSEETIEVRPTLEEPAPRISAAVRTKYLRIKSRLQLIPQSRSDASRPRPAGNAWRRTTASAGARDGVKGNGTISPRALRCMRKLGCCQATRSHAWDQPERFASERPRCSSASEPSDSCEVAERKAQAAKRPRKSG